MIGLVGLIECWVGVVIRLRGRLGCDCLILPQSSSIPTLDIPVAGFSSLPEPLFCLARTFCLPFFYYIRIVFCYLQEGLQVPLPGVSFPEFVDFQRRIS